MTLPFEVSYTFAASWTRPKGRVRTHGRLSAIERFVVPEISEADAPIVARTPSLENEPFYRLFEGDLWHPLVESGIALREDDFRIMLRDGPQTAHLMIRHPATIVVSAREYEKRGTYIRRPYSGDRIAFHGLSTPFDPAHRTMADDARILEDKHGEAIDGLYRAMTDYVLVDGVPHRRCPGPSIVLEKSYSIHASMCNSMKTAFRDDGLVFAMGKSRYRTFSAYLTLPVSAARDPAMAGLMKADDIWGLKNIELLDGFPSHSPYLGDILSHLTRASLEQGKSSIGRMREHAVAADTSRLENWAGFHFAGRDMSTGAIDAETFLRRVCELPIAKDAKEPVPVAAYSRLTGMPNAALTRRDLARYVIAHIGDIDLAHPFPWKLKDNGSTERWGAFSANEGLNRGSRHQTTIATEEITVSVP